MAESVRESLERADATLSGAEPEPAPEPVVESTPEPQAEPEPAPDAEAKPDRLRDEQGRFAPKPKEPAEKAATEPKPNGAAPAPAVQGKAVGVDTPPAAPAAAPVRFPQSWKPGVREMASRLPPDLAKAFAEEAGRIDGEVRKVMQERAEDAKFATRVRETLTPFEGVARARGMDAFGLAGAALQSVTVLQMGTPQQKAQELAGIIRAYGVDVEALASALDGQPAAPQAYQPPVDIDALVDKRLNARLGAAESAQAQVAAQKFLASQPEFLHDVLPQIELVFQAAKAANKNMTYEEAYDQACWMNPETRAILQRRALAKDAETANAATARAKAAAAAAPKSQPAAAPAAKPKGVRAALEAAAEKTGFTP